MAAIRAGYRKGDEARQRILDAALGAFGASGFKGATTRQIAETAGVNLPALTYYFGGKEGLYLACAEEIAGRYRRRMLPPIAEALTALTDGRLTPDAARAHLKRIVGALAELLIANPEAGVWSTFVVREMSEQGPAFDRLYAEVWAPGVELLAGLIARAQGAEMAAEPARIEALMLVSGMTAFSVARPVALKYLDWPDAERERFAEIVARLEAQIDRIGR